MCHTISKPEKKHKPNLQKKKKGLEKKMGKNLHSGNICHQEISIISLYMSVRNVSNVDSHLSWFHDFLYPFPPSTNFCDFL